MKTCMWALVCATLTLLGCADEGANLFSNATTGSVSSHNHTSTSGSVGQGAGGDEATGSGGGSSSTDGGGGGSVSSSSMSSGGAGPGGSGSGGTGGGPLGCSPGSNQCVGLDAQTCDAQGDWQTTSTCPFACSGGACSGVCVPTSTKCNGLVPETCDASGQWVDGQACPFTCSAGTCTGACMPAAVQCNGNSVQTCDGGGMWHDTQLCPYVCSTGACSGVCVPGTEQCSGNTPQTCNASGQWTTGSACPFLCQSGTCSGVCTPGAMKCTGTGTQTCDANAQWATTVACPIPAHTSPTCSGNGVCGWSCQNGFQNCDGNPTNGCETDLSNPATCGSCGHSCSNVSGTATCSAGTCGINCDSGFANCNGGAGCETQLGTLSDCLSCGDTCTAPAHASPLCSPTGCDFTCSGNFEDCDGNPGNGCEIDTSSSLTNCGGCGITCVGVGAACVNGTCNGPVKVTDASTITSLALGTPFAVNEVFWTNSAGQVEKAPSDGGPATVLASGQNAPEAIQMTGPSVVWSTSTVPQAIRSMPVGGGAITDLVTGYGPVEMTNDGQYVYFTTRTAYDPCNCSDSSNTAIYQLGLGGGAPNIINPQVNSEVWPGWPGLVVTGNYVQRIQWATSNAISTVIGQSKTDTTDFYGGGGGGVYVSGTFESFISGRFLVKNDLDDMVMWTTLEISGPALVWMHSGQSPTLIALMPSFIVRGLAADDTNVYVLGRFNAGSEDRLLRYPLVGGAPTTLTDNLYNAANILVDGAHVYWTIDGTKIGSNPPVSAPMIVRMPK